MVYSQTELDAGITYLRNYDALDSFRSIVVRPLWEQLGRLETLDDFEVFSCTNASTDDEIDDIMLKNLDVVYDIARVIPGCTSGGQVCTFLYELLVHSKSRQG